MCSQPTTVLVAGVAIALDAIAITTHVKTRLCFRRSERSVYREETKNLQESHHMPDIRDRPIKRLMSRVLNRLNAKFVGQSRKQIASC